MQVFNRLHIRTEKRRAITIFAANVKTAFIYLFATTIEYDINIKQGACIASALFNVEGFPNYRLFSFCKIILIIPT